MAGDRPAKTSLLHHHIKATVQSQMLSRVESDTPDTQRLFGGQYVSEAFIESLHNLQNAFEEAWTDIGFRQQFMTHLATFRPPSALQAVQKLTWIGGGAQIYLKREDANTVGGHFIVNALGQALLAKRLNRTTVLAETGAGGHGVATAFVCQRLGLNCVIYMGAKNAKARPDQVTKMKTYGAQVVEVLTGEATLREAIAEAFRMAVEQHETAYLLLGGSYGPRPMPMIANAFHSIIGSETRKQMLEMTGNMPDMIVACSGIHSPGVGIFDAFLDDHNVQLLAVEGAGGGIETGLHASVLTQGSLGVYNGACSLVLQDEHGQIETAHSIAPDFCYPSVSPWLAKWHSEGRIQPIAMIDEEAILGCAILTKFEGIECSVEDGHAIAAGIAVASTMADNERLVVCLGGGA